MDKIEILALIIWFLEIVLRVDRWIEYPVIFTKNEKGKPLYVK